MRRHNTTLFWMWRHMSLLLECRCNHRLNGSSSPVLTATSLSYGKSKNSTPQNQNPWPDWDKIWHDWLRWGGDPSCKILCKFLQGGLLGKWVKYTQNFLFIYTFFSSAHPEVRPLKGFLRLICQTTRFLSLIHIWRCRRIERCRSRWSPYH